VQLCLCGVRAALSRFAATFIAQVPSIRDKLALSVGSTLLASHSPLSPEVVSAERVLSVDSVPAELGSSPPPASDLAGAAAAAAVAAATATSTSSPAMPVSAASVASAMGSPASGPMVAPDSLPFEEEDGGGMRLRKQSSFKNLTVNISSDAVAAASPPMPTATKPAAALPQRRASHDLQPPLPPGAEGQATLTLRSPLSASSGGAYLWALASAGR
jgi:hypothetical protein